MISDKPTEASIDISIRWKFPYHSPESELKLPVTAILFSIFSNQYFKKKSILIILNNN